MSARHRCRSAGRTQLAQLWPPVVRPGGADSGCVRTGGVRRPLCPHRLRRRPNADTAAAQAAAVQCSVPPPHRLCRCRAGIKVVQYQKRGRLMAQMQCIRHSLKKRDIIQLKIMSEIYTHTTSKNRKVFFAKIIKLQSVPLKVSHVFVLFC